MKSGHPVPRINHLLYDNILAFQGTSRASQRSLAQDSLSSIFVRAVLCPRAQHFYLGVPLLLGNLGWEVTPGSSGLWLLGQEDAGKNLA